VPSAKIVKKKKKSKSNKKNRGYEKEYAPKFCNAYAEAFSTKVIHAAY